MTLSDGDDLSGRDRFAEPNTKLEHAVETYLPQPREKRSGVALCLSGGGFRAALFHLGALRRLNELGALSKVDTISAVSGGSIVAAHLAERIRVWPAAGDSVPDWDRDVAAPFRQFTSRNLRTAPLFKAFLPWNWFGGSVAAGELARRYQLALIGRRLPELPGRPRFVFCATDMAFGVNWVFERGRVGDYQAGYCSPAPDWPVAHAIAASSCFPPIFNPMPAGLGPDQLKDGASAGLANRNELITGLRLTDGGVYDNMGLEPVWKTHAVVLVSDGGGVFDFMPDRGLFARVMRYTAIQGRQATAIRKRWLISSFISGEISGTYWGIGSAIGSYGEPAAGYSRALVERVIAEVRTDLDAFSEAEAAVLENHGYLLADAAIRRHAPGLTRPGAPSSSAPHREWLDEEKVSRFLADSHRRTFFGRT